MNERGRMGSGMSGCAGVCLRLVSACRSPELHLPPVTVDFGTSRGHDGGVLDILLLIARALALACRGHHELVLENLALRQQPRALQHTVRRPRLQRLDRVFWIILASCWQRLAHRNRARPAGDGRAVASRVAPATVGPMLAPSTTRSPHR